MEASILIGSYLDELLKVDNFLFSAEKCGCHLLRGNVVKLATVLHELVRIKEMALYPVMEHLKATAGFVPMDHQFDHIEDKVHTVVELMGETEERMNENFAAIQKLLDELLPKIADHVESMKLKQLPALEAALKPHEQEALAKDIKECQDMFIREEEERKAAAAAAFLKTRAGRKAKQLEEELKREEEAKKHPQAAEGGEGKKKKEEEVDDAHHKPSVRERREARDAWHKEHVEHRKEHICEGCGKARDPAHPHQHASTTTKA